MEASAGVHLVYERTAANLALGPIRGTVCITMGCLAVDATKLRASSSQEASCREASVASPQPYSGTVNRTASSTRIPPSPEARAGSGVWTVKGGAREARTRTAGTVTAAATQTEKPRESAKKRLAQVLQN